MGRAGSTSQSASALAEHLRIVFGKMKRQLRKQAGSNNLTPSEVGVVLRLEKDGPATVSGLARAEGMRPQSMSAIVTSLQQAGLVQGLPDRNDGRKTLISLTKKCQKWLVEGRAARQDWLTALVEERLSLQEQRTLAAAVHLLERLTED